MKKQKASSATVNPDTLFSQALSLQQTGKLDEAETIAKDLLKSYPDNIYILNLLGIIYGQKGNAAESIKVLKKAVAINPQFAEAHNNCGMTLYNLKKYKKAIDHYDKAIAINPQYVQVYKNRGLAYYDLKQYDQAFENYSQTVALAPDAEAYNSCGIALYKLKRHGEASEHYNKAIALNPWYTDAYNNRGIAFAALKQFDKAIIDHDKAIALNPNFAQACNSRGLALHMLKRYDEALVSFSKAIALSPNFEMPYINRSYVLIDLQRYEEALNDQNKVIVLNPDYAEAYNSRGIALFHLGRYEEAIENYDKVIALDPEYADAYWNKGLLKLRLGDYEEGWKLYEWRWKRSDIEEPEARIFEEPLWLGKESLAGKTILLFADQGVGDAIQTARYIPMVEALGPKIVLEVHAGLVELFSNVYKHCHVIARGTTLPPFDCYCPLLSLPLAFGTTLKNLPATVPYLFADPAKKNFWQQRLGAKTKPRIGLIWSGASKHKNDHNRSIALSLLTPLLDVECEFISLQKEMRPSDQNILAHSEIISVADELNDFSDTAALISELDLVISVDTSVAHLAGALGKPVWILLPFTPDFRWLLKREDSSWYPTAKLFRQSKARDWESVIERVKAALKKEDHNHEQ